MWKGTKRILVKVGLIIKKQNREDEQKWKERFLSISMETNTRTNKKK